MLVKKRKRTYLDQLLGDYSVGERAAAKIAIEKLLRKILVEAEESASPTPCGQDDNVSLYKLKEIVKRVGKL